MSIAQLLQPKTWAALFSWYIQHFSTYSLSPPVDPLGFGKPLHIWTCEPASALELCNLGDCQHTHQPQRLPLHLGLNSYSHRPKAAHGVPSLCSSALLHFSLVFFLFGDADLLEAWTSQLWDFVCVFPPLRHCLLSPIPQSLIYYSVSIKSLCINFLSYIGETHSRWWQMLWKKWLDSGGCRVLGSGSKRNPPLPNHPGPKWGFSVTPNPL